MLEKTLAARREERRLYSQARESLRQEKKNGGDGGRGVRTLCLQTNKTLFNCTLRMTEPLFFHKVTPCEPTTHIGDTG